MCGNRPENGREKYCNCNFMKPKNTPGIYGEKRKESFKTRLQRLERNHNLQLKVILLSSDEIDN